MPQDRHTPGFPQQTLAATSTEVCHVGVVVREPKQPADREREREIRTYRVRERQFHGFSVYNNYRCYHMVTVHTFCVTIIMMNTSS